MVMFLPVEPALAGKLVDIKQKDRSEKEKQILDLEKRKNANPVMSHESFARLVDTLNPRQVWQVLDEAFKAFSPMFFEYLPEVRDDGVTTELMKNPEGYLKKLTGVETKFMGKKSERKFAGQYHLLKRLILLNYGREEELDPRKVLLDFLNGKIPKFLIVLAHELVHFRQYAHLGSLIRNIYKWMPFINYDRPAHEAVATEIHAYVMADMFLGATDSFGVRAGALASSADLLGSKILSYEDALEIEKKLSDLVFKLILLSGDKMQLGNRLYPRDEERKNPDLYYKRLEAEIDERLKKLGVRNVDEYLRDLSKIKQLEVELNLLRLKREARKAILDVLERTK